MLCPYCKEEIAEGAIKCKHCKSMLDSASNAASLAKTPENQDNLKEKAKSLLPIGKKIFGMVRDHLLDDDDEEEEDDEDDEEDDED